MFIGDKYDDEGYSYYNKHGSIADRLDTLESILTSFQLLTNRVAALENKSTKALPYTADELIAKLESI